MKRVAFPALLAVGFGLALAGLAAANQNPSREILERGRYLASIMDCAGCHTGGALMGKPDPARALAGSEIGFQIPGLGVFYPPNLTSDPETGLGEWSEEEILAAVTRGVRPNGRQLAPAMPWHAYAALNADDGRALAAYLKRLPPVAFKAPGPFGEGEKPTAPYLTMAMPE